MAADQVSIDNVSIIVNSGYKIQVSQTWINSIFSSPPPLGSVSPSQIYVQGGDFSGSSAQPATIGGVYPVASAVISGELSAGSAAFGQSIFLNGSGPQGLSFGSNNSAWEFTNNSSLVGLGVVGAVDIGCGIDFGSLVFNSAALRFNGFSVDGSGNLTAKSVSIGDGAINNLTTSIESINIVNGGLFTAFPEILNVGSPFGGTDFVASVLSMAASGNVILIEDSGTNYVSGDVVTLVGATGTSPSYTVTASLGKVTNLVPLTAGSVTALPTFPALFSGGSGTGLTATVGFTISSVDLSSVGSGYDPNVAPQIIVYTPGNASQTINPAILTATLNSSLIQSKLSLNNLVSDLANVQIGPASSINVSSNKGFLQIPFMNGAPSATPEDITGPSFVWNDTTKTLNIYSPSGEAWYHIVANIGAA